MDADYNTPLEAFMKESIRKSGLVKHVPLGEVLDEVSSKLIKELITHPKKIFLSDEGLVYESEDGEIYECPSYGANITSDGRWLSEKIPPLPFDVEQNGNLRKAVEAESAYILSIISLVLDDADIKKELTSISEDYDYQTMSRNNSRKDFSEFLEELQALQSTTINVAVSAARYKISVVKKDSEVFLRENIPEGQLAGLRNLSNSIKAINREFSMGPLSPMNVKGLTKIEVLKLLNERDEQVWKLIEGSGDVGDLYRLANLSTEYVSPIMKRRAQKLAIESVEAYYSELKKVPESQGEHDSLQKKWTRRYIKIMKQEKRREQIQKYLSSPETFKFPVKM